MQSYKELRYQFKKEIYNGTCYCILSCLPITNIKDLSLEHYYPKSLLPRYVANQRYNIYPAIKIINGLKGCLTPCEWEDNKLELYEKTLRKGHLKHNDREIIKQAIIKAQEVQINPCNYCILSKQCRDCR